MRNVEKPNGRARTKRSMNVSISKDISDRVRQTAQSNGISISTLIERALQTHFRFSEMDQRSRPS